MDIKVRAIMPFFYNDKVYNAGECAFVDFEFCQNLLSVGFLEVVYNEDDSLEVAPKQKASSRKKSK